MSEKLLCPFCGQELEEEIFFRGRVFVSCDNPNCIISDWGGCSKQIIMELITTRKALDVALDSLRHTNWFFDGDYNILTFVYLYSYHGEAFISRTYIL